MGVVMLLLTSLCSTTQPVLGSSYCFLEVGEGGRRMKMFCWVLIYFRTMCVLKKLQPDCETALFQMLIMSVCVCCLHLRPLPPHQDWNYSQDLFGCLIVYIRSASSFNACVWLPYTPWTIVPHLVDGPASELCSNTFHALCCTTYHIKLWDTVETCSWGRLFQSKEGSDCIF